MKVSRSVTAWEEIDHLGGALVLGLGRGAQQATVDPRAERGVGPVGQAPLGPDLLEQMPVLATADDAVDHRQRIVAGVGPARAAHGRRHRRLTSTRQVDDHDTRSRPLAAGAVRGGRCRA
jgi:hypothetical protein